MNKNTSYGFTIFLLIIAIFLWSSTFTTFKLAYEHYNWAYVIFVRLIVASLFFISIWKFIKPKVKLNKQDYGLILLLGLLEPCLYFLFESLALTYTSATQASMVSAIMPILVGLGAWIFFRERLSKTNWLGFFIAFFGVIALTLANDASMIDEKSPNPLLGNFLEFIAMTFATFYTLILRKLSTKVNTWFLTAAQSFIGSIFFLPFIFFVSPETGIYAEFSWIGFAIIAYMALFVSVLAYGIFNFAIGRIGAAKASVFINLIPIMSAIIAYFVLKESLNINQLLAIGFILLGVLLAEMKFKRLKK